MRDHTSFLPRPLFLIGVALMPILSIAQVQRVLFIGNSYTQVNNLPGLVRELALGLGDTLEVTMVAPGGYTLQQHASYAPTLSAISQGTWDFVVIQEQSQRPSFPIAQVMTDVFPYAAALVDSIAAHAPCAEVLFYMTWGRQNGDAQNCPNWPPVCTYEGMQELLRERYLMMAVDNLSWCAPVGVAWRVVREDHPTINLYDADGSHPSLAGSYLAASVITSSLRRAACTASTFNAALDPATASLLRDVASSVVTDSMDIWNIGVRDPVAQPVATDLGGGTYQFDALGATGGQIQWIFGDGATGSGASVVHTYTQPGIYFAALVVQDPCGRSDTALVQVDLSTLGIPSSSTPSPRLVPVAHGLRIEDIQGPSRLWLIDPAGRLLLDRVMNTGEDPIVRFTWPPILHWRLLSSDGKTNTGTFQRP